MLRKATFGNSLSSSLKKVRAIPGTAQNFFQCKSCLFAEVSNRSHAGKAVTKFNPLNLEYNFAEINFGDTVNVTQPVSLTDGCRQFVVRFTRPVL